MLLKRGWGNMKKKLTFAGALVSAVTLIAFAIIMIRGIIVIAQSGNQELISNLGISIFEVLIMIVTIVFDFMTIPFTKTGKTLLGGKWIVSSAIYGNALIACLTIYDVFYASGVVLAIMLIFIAGLVTATTLMSVDFYKERKEEDNMSTMRAANADELKARLADKKDADEIIAEEESLQKRLEKAKELKAQGLITDEEFNKYKNEIFNKEMDK